MEIFQCFFKCSIFPEGLLHYPEYRKQKNLCCNCFSFSKVMVIKCIDLFFHVPGWLSLKLHFIFLLLNFMSRLMIISICDQVQAEAMLFLWLWYNILFQIAILIFLKGGYQLFNIDRLSTILAKERSTSRTYIGCMKNGPVIKDPKLNWQHIH